MPWGCLIVTYLVGHFCPDIVKTTLWVLHQELYVHSSLYPLIFALRSCSPQHTHIHIQMNKNQSCDETFLKLFILFSYIPNVPQSWSALPNLFSYSPSPLRGCPPPIIYAIRKRSCGSSQRHCETTRISVTGQMEQSLADRAPWSFSVCPCRVMIALGPLSSLLTVKSAGGAPILLCSMQTICLLVGFRKPVFHNNP